MLLRPTSSHTSQAWTGVRTTRNMADLIADKAAAPLSIHTSGGVPAALNTFISTLEPHLPWKETQDLDWCLSLQLEGASAVWAGIDMLLQLQMLKGQANRKKVAVGKNHTTDHRLLPLDRALLFSRSIHSLLTPCQSQEKTTTKKNY